MVDDSSKVAILLAKHLNQSGKNIKTGNHQNETLGLQFELPVYVYIVSDSRRLTFLKETARSPEKLCATTGKLYHSLCQ